MISELLCCDSAVSAGCLSVIQGGFFSQVVILPPSPALFYLNRARVMSVTRIAADVLERMHCRQSRDIPRAPLGPGTPPATSLSFPGEESRALPPTAQPALGVTQGFSLPSATLLTCSQVQRLEGTLGCL